MLIIVDFDVMQLSAGLFPGIAARMLELVAECRVRNAARLCFVPPTLTRPAASGGVMGHPHPPELLENITQTAMTAALHVSAGRVKIAARVHEKGLQTPFDSALDFRGGDDPATNPLRLAALLSIIVTLEPA